jgi:hypothetical protein
MKKLIIGTVIGLAASPAAAQEAKPINLGYNVMEIARASNAETRTRLITNADVTLGKVNIGYHGLNEMNDGESGTYFGRHALMLSESGSPVKALAVVKTVDSGTIDTKLGVRDKSIVKKLGGYGFIDATTDEHALNITAFYGKEIGGVQFELMHAIEESFRNKPGKRAQNYTELQVNRYITRNAAIFGRAELSYNGNSTVMVGGLLKLN